jgi:type I restriction enzyme S subunit
MEVKPGYKKTEVGVIPENWQTPKVGETCDFIVPGRNKPRLFNGDIPWITTPDLELWKPVTESRLGLCISRSEAKAVGSKVVPPGSVLMSCAGELGIVAMTQVEIVVNQQLHVFIPRDLINGTFLLYALAFRKNQIESYGTKTAVPYLNKSACNSIPIPLPPIFEQCSIAEALNDVDALLVAMEGLIAKRRDLKQAAMQQLLTGQTRLPGFSGAWERRRLGDIAEIKKGQLITEKTTKPGNIPVIAGGTKPAYFHNIPNRKGKTITISSSGAGAGYVAFFENEIFASDCSTISEGQSYSIEFLYFVLRLLQNEIYTAQSGGAQPHIHPSDLFPITLGFPNLTEQTAIASVLTDMNAEIEALEQRLAKTRDLKQAMMQELLTGRIRLVSPEVCHA